MLPRYQTNNTQVVFDVLKIKAKPLLLAFREEQSHMERLLYMCVCVPRRVVVAHSSLLL